MNLALNQYGFALAIVCSSFLYSDLALADDSGKWINLIPRVDVSSSVVAGNWEVDHGVLRTDATASSRLALPFQPTSEYDFRIAFTRTSGVHSVALMFVSSAGQATFEVDAWGQHLAGLQMINGQTMQQNPTRVENQTLENGRRYSMRVEVRQNQIRAFLDDQLLATQQIDGSAMTMPRVWQMPNAKSLGLGAYSAATTFHKVEVRPIGSAKLALNSTPTRTSDTTTGMSRPRPDVTIPRGATNKRVLLVIANQDFFYREYSHPREELERVGVVVDVAAGQKQLCRPHANSGQQGNGAVMPDIAIANADAARYDAIMFSGGWGSSMYQYAFDGSYSNRVYNGDRRVKEATNRLLNEFIRQDKYVGALCHGVSVLSWARVNGRSILSGKQAVGSPRQSPAGIYNGRRSQPLSRWNAEVNGARLSPARSIGDPRTSADDVRVDGKIITGEDDNSARLFGKTLARLLTQN